MLRMFRVRQSFTAPTVTDVRAETLAKLQQLPLESVVRPGETVAITAGSRGIARIAEITRAVVDHFKSLGAVPFLVPAMGSHGGGTVEGQVQILHGYGMTPEAMGCEIRATMDTVVVDHTPDGVPVHFDRYAHEANHVFVVNRIKPHTGYVGPVESGLHKMLLIGLGKHTGAKIYHQAIVQHPFEWIVSSVSESVIRNCRVCGGLAIVENARDETALIEAVPPAEFFPRESALLLKAIDWLPRLPFPYFDLLVIDRIGKNISGSGLDTNVVGRKFGGHHATEKDRVNCLRIHLRSLTPETHGNASGVGLAEFCHQRVVDHMDVEMTRINCLTSAHPIAAMIPLAYSNDRAAIDAALSTIGLTPPAQARIAQISDTLHIENLLLSEAFYAEAAARSDLEILSPPEPIAYDVDGNLAAVDPHLPMAGWE